MSSSTGSSVSAAAAAAAAQRSRILDRDEKPAALTKQLTSFSAELTWFKRFSSELSVAAKLHPPSACASSGENSPRRMAEQHFFETHPDAKKYATGIASAVAEKAAIKLGRI